MHIWIVHTLHYYCMNEPESFHVNLQNNEIMPFLIVQLMLIAANGMAECYALYFLSVSVHILGS